MIKIKILIIILLSFLFAEPALALQIQDFVFGTQNNGMTAEAYLVIDKLSGQILLQKEPAKLWPPASITKLAAALVVLDYNPGLKKTISMAKADEVGGARIYTKTGVVYNIRDLFYASLIASANNATNALARSTGLTRPKFVAAMNQKARELGAKNTAFVDATGISEKNQSTAEDIAVIARTAFENQEISQAAKFSEFVFKSIGSKRYTHKIKNTNKLLGDSGLEILAGKTGYLVESRYNFVGLIKDQFSQESLVVILGAANPKAQFQEAKQLIFLAGLAKSVFSLGGLVLGENTATINN